MEHYYIYSSSNQAYSTLINNAVLSKSLTTAALRSDTVSFLSENYIFITKEYLSDKDRYRGITDTYNPVVFEISDDKINSLIPVLFVSKRSEGYLVSKEWQPLGYYSNIDNCIGAFVYGTIPFAFISHIIFENIDNKNMFRRSSPDLWYPVEKFCTWEDIGTDKADDLNYDYLLQAYESAETQITDFRKQLLNQSIVIDLKIKAAGYFAVEATRGWRTESFKTNVDYSLAYSLTLQNKENELNNYISETINMVSPIDGSELLKDYYKERDSIFDGTGKSLNAELFYLIGETLVSSDLNTDGYGLFKKLSESCLCGCPEAYKDDVSRALLKINNFLKSSTMNPKIALRELIDFPVLQAMMVFIDYRNNASHLRNACKILNQNARRYAYIMFALFNGMGCVNGTDKQNMLLEYQLEAVTLNDNSSKELISSIPCVQNITGGETLYGVPVDFEIYYGETVSYQMITEKASNIILRDVFSLMKSNIPTDKIVVFSDPITITVKVRDEEKQIIIQTKDDLLAAQSILKSILNERQMEPDMNMFRELLKEKSVFEELYHKYSEQLQSICRRI